jgi:DNA-binding response OmpR family regulator
MNRPLRILSVDDEPSIGASMRYIFGQPLYELASVGDGEAALERMASDGSRFDVVITDDHMPGVSGVELVRRLRARGFSGKIMVLSAHLSRAVRLAYAELGVDAMVDKPFNIVALRTTLDQLAA